jgi:hypothetical protein
MENQFFLIQDIYYATHFYASRTFLPETADYLPTSHGYSPVQTNNEFYLVVAVLTNRSVTFQLYKLQYTVEIKQ